ncbi:uncharacterized protein J8A68_001906 [[Candida] subhashii]|uniref:Uncharacterized protein n=1 Tax=[Candida] subhashii TaxID=561895 RepID=A0A8J5URE7_9ASCO|nr:uncharacterized protein J8A68_001906 [[Candida] subhashii]KAG7664562.1 hypothetical protein J8A68_001906 [[Candida] subhashii]
MATNFAYRILQKPKNITDEQQMSQYLSQPVDFGPWESSMPDELFKEEVDFGRVIVYSNPQQPHVQRNAYISDVKKSIEHYFSPSTEVNIHPSNISWFWRRLKQVDKPISIILQNTNRLFDGKNLDCFDGEFMEFSEKVKALNNGIAWNYSLSTITNIDLLNKAIKSKQYFSMNNHREFIRETQNFNWKQIENDNDKLVQQLSLAYQVKVIDKRNETIVQPDDKDLLATISNYIKNSFERSHATETYLSTMPYDIEYNTFSILTINRPSAKDNHRALVELLEESPYKIIAARLSTHLAMRRLLDDYNRSLTSQSGSRLGYTEKLEFERQRREITRNNCLGDLLTLLGKKGLVNVSNGPRCIYLLS